MEALDQECEEHTNRATMVGINHVAIEVDDVDAAVEFYGDILDFSLRGRGEGMAFIDMIEYKGIQFTKDPCVLRGMGLEGLEKTPEAIKQLEAKKMSP